MNLSTEQTKALAVVTLAAADQYCPIWELLDELAQELGIDYETAAELTISLRTVIEHDHRILFFRSTDLYGDVQRVLADEFFAALKSKRRIADGPPYYYIHRRLAKN
jgi:hypothetical protein